MPECYAVIGGRHYDGDDFDSLRLFDCQSIADAYRERLEVVEGYDYAKISEREIIDKPPSLKEQALEALETEDDSMPLMSGKRAERFELIRRALESLPD